jgi:hypothetical protein
MSSDADFVSYFGRDIIIDLVGHKLPRVGEMARDKSAIY